VFYDFDSCSNVSCLQSCGGMVDGHFGNAAVNRSPHDARVDLAQFYEALCNWLLLLCDF